MARPTKLTKELQQIIGDKIALGLTYKLPAESAGITYKCFNQWMQQGKNSTSGKYFEFYQYIQLRNAKGALKLLERLNSAASCGNCQVCVWILERRFPEEFGRRVYRETNIVSENRNKNIEITVNDADVLRKQILAQFD